MDETPTKEKEVEKTPAELARDVTGAKVAPAKKIVRVVSTQTVDFPEFGWGIISDTEKELPDDERMHAAILAHKAITKIN